MAKKRTHLEQAIANLESERSVLDLAIAKLRTQLALQPKRKGKAASPSTGAVMDPDPGRTIPRRAEGGRTNG